MKMNLDFFRCPPISEISHYRQVVGWGTGKDDQKKNPSIISYFGDRKHLQMLKFRKINQKCKNK